MQSPASTPTTPFRIGARGSHLSQRQAALVEHALRALQPATHIQIQIHTIVTTGDRRLETPLPDLGGKGAFTLEIEEALLAGRIDCAVHSLKDLPVEDRPGLTIAAVLPRASVADALVSRDGTPLAALAHGAVVGTSSPRRAAQLLAARPDLRIANIRGNVETRLRKTLDPAGPYDATVLARAGLDRLDLEDRITETLPLAVMLPAPGQGAIAIQVRVGSPGHDAIRTIDHLPTALATAAERGFLTGLGGGCSLPVAAYAELHGGMLLLRGRVVALDGSNAVDVADGAVCATPAAAAALGMRLAAEALAAGAPLERGHLP